MLSPISRNFNCVVCLFSCSVCFRSFLQCMSFLKMLWDEMHWWCRATIQVWFWTAPNCSLKCKYYDVESCVKKKQSHVMKSRAIEFTFYFLYNAIQIYVKIHLSQFEKVNTPDTTQHSCELWWMKNKMIQMKEKPIKM